MSYSSLEPADRRGFGLCKNIENLVDKCWIKPTHKKKQIQTSPRRKPPNIGSAITQHAGQGDRISCSGRVSPGGAGGTKEGKSK